jgi:hypothetical protein
LSTLAAETMNVQATFGTLPEKCISGWPGSEFEPTIRKLCLGKKQISQKLESGFGSFNQHCVPIELFDNKACLAPRNWTHT